MGNENKTLIPVMAANSLFITFSLRLLISIISSRVKSRTSRNDKSSSGSFFLPKTDSAVLLSTGVARIFRGIVVDGNGVITSMNSRAMKSARNAAKNGTGNDPRNKMGEKSRQAAKIDKAKDLIDEVVENGGTGSAMSDVSSFYNIVY